MPSKRSKQKALKGDSTQKFNKAVITKDQTQELKSTATDRISAIIERGGLQVLAHISGRSESYLEKVGAGKPLGNSDTVLMRLKTALETIENPQALRAWRDGEKGQEFRELGLQ